MLQWNLYIIRTIKVVTNICFTAEIRNFQKNILKIKKPFTSTQVRKTVQTYAGNMLSLEKQKKIDLYLLTFLFIL